MREMNGQFYGRPEWPGKVFMTLRGILPENVMYVCHTKSTDFQAIPAEKVLAPMDGVFKLEARGFKALSETGEVLHLPLKDERRPLTDWEEECEAADEGFRSALTARPRATRRAVRVRARA